MEMLYYSVSTCLYFDYYFNVCNTHSEDKTCTAGTAPLHHCIEYLMCIQPRFP